MPKPRTRRNVLLAAALTEPLPSTPAQYGADIDREETQWSKVVKASGAKAE
jgi:hypothetical protein